MLRVSVDPFRSEKNLQVAEQMTDDEQDQNDTGHRDDHFSADGRMAKLGDEAAWRYAHGCGSG